MSDDIKGISQQVIRLTSQLQSSYEGELNRVGKLREALTNSENRLYETQQHVTELEGRIANSSIAIYAKERAQQSELIQSLAADVANQKDYIKILESDKAALKEEVRQKSDYINNLVEEKSITDNHAAALEQTLAQQPIGTYASAAGTNQTLRDQIRKLIREKEELRSEVDRLQGMDHDLRSKIIELRREISRLSTITASSYFTKESGVTEFTVPGQLARIADALEKSNAIREEEMT